MQGYNLHDFYSLCRGSVLPSPCSAHPLGSSLATPHPYYTLHPRQVARHGVIIVT